MEKITDLLIVDLTADQFLLLYKALGCILRLPLEGRKGLGNKASHTDGHLRCTRLIALGIFIKFVKHLLGKENDSLKILLCLCGQTHHKIELDLRLTRFKRHIDRAKQILLKHVFVDDVTKSL